MSRYFKTSAISISCCIDKHSIEPNKSLINDASIIFLSAPQIFLFPDSVGKLCFLFLFFDPFFKLIAIFYAFLYKTCSCCITDGSTFKRKSSVHFLLDVPVHVLNRWSDSASLLMKILNIYSAWLLPDPHYTQLKIYIISPLLTQNTLF